ncbi:MAG: hypothetical protein AB1657_02570 [Candidatus Micrarchaeota archaeon]
MRKLQRNDIPAGQADARPVSPGPGREWPRWKKIAVVAVSVVPLMASSCKKIMEALENRQNAEPTPISGSIGNCFNYPTAAPESRYRIITKLDDFLIGTDRAARFQAANCLVDISEGGRLRDNVVEALQEFYAAMEPASRSGLVDALEKSGDLLRLAIIAGSNGTEPQLRDRIVGIFETKLHEGVKLAPTILELLSRIAMSGQAEPQLRGRIVNMLRNILENSDPPAQRELVTMLTEIAKYDYTESQVKDGIIDTLKKANAFSELAVIAIDEGALRLREIAGWLAGRAGESCAEGVTFCERAISALVFIATHEETPPQLKESILTTLRRNRAFSSLADVATDKNTEPYLRREILKMFGEALDDKNEGVPQAAIDAAAGLPVSQRLVDVLEAASAHRLKDVRLKAMKILYLFACDDEISLQMRTRIVGIATRALRDADRDIREKALEVLEGSLSADDLDTSLRERILGILESESQVSRRVIGRNW